VDVPGVASTLIAVGALVYGIIEGDQGWTYTRAGSTWKNAARCSAVAPSRTHGT
jgi:hypothetical protein